MKAICSASRGTHAQCLNAVICELAKISAPTTSPPNSAPNVPILSPTPSGRPAYQHASWHFHDNPPTRPISISNLQPPPHPAASASAPHTHNASEPGTSPPSTPDPTFNIPAPSHTPNGGVAHNQALLTPPNHRRDTSSRTLTTHARVPQRLIPIILDYDPAASHRHPVLSDLDHLYRVTPPNGPALTYGTLPLRLRDKSYVKANFSLEHVLYTPGAPDTYVSAASLAALPNVSLLLCEHYPQLYIDDHQLVLRRLKDGSYVFWARVTPRVVHPAPT